MHHALHIEEILLSVFSHCYADKSWCRYANANLAALARTCKMFKEPALDMIWAELYDLTPLVRCLPDASWVRSAGVYSLRTRLEQADWDTILAYAHRVRALPLLRGSLGLAADCIEALSNAPSSAESIFPNLRIVRLYEPKATIVPLVRHLANPQLTSISFESAENLGGAITTFGERCPIVTDFGMAGLPHADSDTTLGLIRCWQNLCSAWCRVGLNVDAVLHLSRLRYLRCMGFTVHDAVVDRIHAPGSMLTFPALEDLCLVSEYLTPIRRLLRYFRTPEVHDLSVGVSACPTATDLMSFFVSLQEACTHASLNNLSLIVDCVNNEENEIPLEDASPYYITFDHLRPLTVFLNIKSITLDIPCGIHLNERELLRLASSWPHLEHFEVDESVSWPESSAITPGGFLQLLERCRSLRVFYFKFDCRGYTELPQGHPWRGLTMPKDASIHLLDSPIEEESVDALGFFFHVAPFPDFELLTYFDFRNSARDRELYVNRWEEVRDLAHGLWDLMNDLRSSLETRSSESWHQSQ
ncbi:hypothetical protein HD554DRAFT_1008873 [Boletus coccyginus]|nr:hypothetical protein HD554DRAFT_1008873 [Boletus coccyginus]